MSKVLKFLGGTNRKTNFAGLVLLVLLGKAIYSMEITVEQLKEHWEFLSAALVTVYGFFASADSREEQAS